jgi:hypothetical protein
MIHAAWAAIRLFAGKWGARGLEAAKDARWQFWAVLALVMAIPVNGCIQHGRGYQKGREAVLGQLRDAQAKADERALKAIAKAEGRATQEVLRFEAEQAALRDAIKQAESEGGNALDGLF